MTVLQEIRTWFLTQLEDADIIVVQEGTAQTRDPTTTQCRLKIFPREPVLISIGSGAQHLQGGLVSIQVMGPRRSFADIDSVAQQVRNLFTQRWINLPTAGRLQITQTWIESAQEEPASIIVPVFSRYEIATAA